MKITPEHFAHMKSAITEKLKTLQAIDFSVPDYKAKLAADSRVKDVDKRLRWDLFYASKLAPWSCDNVYPYANDDHVDTALRAIQKELNF